MFYVYLHELPNGKRYVGQTKQPLERWSNGSGYIGNIEFYKAIVEYGWENIKHYILIETDTRESALVYEKLFTVLLNSEDCGYNNTTTKSELVELYKNKIEVTSEYIFANEESDLIEDGINIFKKYDIPRSAAKSLILEWSYSERDRNIAEDRYLNGMSLSELSQKYDISVSQIKRACYEIRDTIEKHI